MDDDKKINIIIDTRETKPLKFSSLKNVGNTITKKLDFGDYSTPKLINLVVIERKTKGDLFGTLGTGRKRFMNELDRAKNAGVKFFYIVIESSLDDIYKGNLVYTKKRGKFMTKPYANNIISQLLSFIMKHPLNIIPLFASDSKSSSKIVREILYRAEKYLEQGIINC